MKLPQYPEYEFAVQCPQIAFGNDPDLKSSRVEETQKGSPRVRSGNYAYTFRMQSGARQWAVRCFRRYDPGQQRYTAISRFVKAHRSPFLVTTEYREQGILVQGAWYPITKTAWVSGQTLEVFLEGNVRNAALLGSLLEQFQKLAATLEGWGIAHGDLQHGNILVSNGKLVLIDYDGMYVPALSGYDAPERGHPDYQHPARNVEFGPDLDRFSSIVIYLTLKALATKPELWAKYSAGGDHLILKQKDFIAPDSSPVLHDLEAIPALGAFVRSFRSVCKGSLAEVPTLASFLAGKVAVAPTIIRAPFEQWGQYPIIGALDRGQLFGRVGEKVTVVGQISSVKDGLTYTGSPYFFLNFGDWQQSNLTLVLWSEAITLFQTQGKDPRTYRNRWVSVTGLVTQYQKEDFPARPQILISTPSEIEILPGGEREARQRLGMEYRAPILTDDDDWNTLEDEWDEPAPDTSNSAAAQEHLRRGKEWYEKGRLDKAVEEYKIALKLFPNWAEVRCWLGLAYEQQSRPEAAIIEYEAVLRLEPGNSWAWRQLGWVHGNAGRLDKSTKAFKSALKLSQTDADAHFALGWVYLQQGRLDEAIGENLTALAINPNMDDARLNLGVAYARKGRLDKANAEYQAATCINPSNMLAHHNLGMNYRSQGRTQEAMRELRVAAQLGYESAREILRQLGHRWDTTAPDYQPQRRVVDWEAPPLPDNREEDDSLWF